MSDELLNQIDEIVTDLFKNTFIVTNDCCSDLYDQAISFLKSYRLIKTERHANRYIANSPDIYDIHKNGIREYLNENNRIKNLELKIKKLTAINVDLQNKQMKRFVLYAIISFVFGAIVTNLKDILFLLKLMTPQ